MADPKPPPLGPPAQFFNLAQVRSTPREFFLDLLQATGRSASSGQEPLLQAILIASVVTTPAHAKALMKALKRNVDLYEKQFGTIAEDPKPPETAH